MPLLSSIGSELHLVANKLSLPIAFPISSHPCHYLSGTMSRERTTLPTLKEERIEYSEGAHQRIDPDLLETRKPRIVLAVAITETEALMTHARVVQRQHFQAKAELLSHGDQVNNEIKLWNLPPFIDSRKVMRVGGRVQHGEFPDTKVHFALLPASNHHTALVEGRPSLLVTFSLEGPSFPFWTQICGICRTLATPLAAGQQLLQHYGEDNAPPLKWGLVRVSAWHPGVDGLVHLVTARSEPGEFKRPIIKFSSLPVYIVKHN
ncbi:unnamed protein product [Allacma fusca]|uniref:DUF5641 domain-containing protein n=1 Tax=Allacma fusca TaxID=39272 RepID=A0A8J2KCV4_9HEXA|nr:unnamed protein product [Allacma fusca]